MQVWNTASGFNITLPFEQHANPTVQGTTNLLPFHFFFTRKLFFVKEADALVLCPGGFGTLDEALEVLTLIQTGKSPLVPVVLLDAPGGKFWQGALDFIHHQLEENRYILPTDMKLVKLVYSAEEAVEQINQFYSNYHSSRWLKHQFVIRMNHKLSDRALEHMQEAFADLCLSDHFHQHAYNGEEHDEARFSHLARLAFNFNARDHGRLRELVDYINLPENWASNPATGTAAHARAIKGYVRQKKRPAIEIASRFQSIVHSSAAEQAVDHFHGESPIRQEPALFGTLPGIYR